MSNILVSLVSDQTIPNVLFIREMENKLKENIGKYLFISTETMENKGKTDFTIQGSHIDKSKIEIIKVIEDSIDDIENKLKGWHEREINDADQIIVNLTGGTKIMSIAVYEFFGKLGSPIYYLPIGKNVYKQIFPFVKHREYELNFRTPLRDYLTSYGIEIKSRNINKTLKSKQYTEYLFRKFLNNEIDSKALDELRKKRNEKKISINEKIKSFLNEINFSTETEGTLNKKEINYLTGGWFEEYTYNLIKNQLGLDNDKIGLNLNIFRGSTQNELDIMFVYENVLYVIECKTALKDNGRNLLNDTLYKLSALKKNFGLIVKGYLFTLDKNLRDEKGNIKSDYQNRASLLDITLVDRAILSDGKKMNEVFNKITGR